MSMKLILFGTIFWLPFFLHYVNVNETKFKKNIAVGVTFPFHGREDAEVLTRLSRFKKQSLILCVILVLLIAPCLFLDGMGPIMTAYCTWIDLAIVLPYIPYVLCNRDLKRIKEARGWMQDDKERRTVTVDLAAMPEERWISPVVFLPAVLICFLPLLWEITFWPVCVAMGLSCVLMWAVYRFCYRNKSEAVDGNTELTITLTRIRRYYWGRSFLILTYLTALMSVLMLVQMRRPALMMALIILLSAVITVIVIRTELRLRALQERLTKDSGKSCYVDDDDKWIGGLLYYNPQDARLIINQRTGMNTTVNIARPAGMFLTGLTLILLLVLPFTGLFFDAWLGHAESRPIELQIEDGMLSARCGGTHYEIMVEDIASVTLAEELPDRLSRVWGTGMDKYISGRFSSPETGAVFVIADPTEPPFLLIETKEGAHYLFGTRDEAEVRGLYEVLK